MRVDSTVFTISWAGDQATGTRALQQERELNRFLADVERRALRIAEIAVRDRDEALDLVQDAMIRLARNYGGRNSDEWAPLFYRILQNGIRDWHRRQAVRRRVLVWFGRGQGDEDDFDAVAAAPDPNGRAPDEVLENREAMRDLEAALRVLPARQREAFMLRTFECLDVPRQGHRPGRSRWWLPQAQLAVCSVADQVRSVRRPAGIRYLKAKI